MISPDPRESSGHGRLGRLPNAAQPPHPQRTPPPRLRPKVRDPPRSGAQGPWPFGLSGVAHRPAALPAASPVATFPRPFKAFSPVRPAALRHSVAPSLRHSLLVIPALGLSPAKAWGRESTARRNRTARQLGPRLHGDDEQPCALRPFVALSLLLFVPSFLS